MSLKHAILGFLDIEPLSGYDLKKKFGSTAQFYWSATHSQIYRTLEQITEEGLATKKIIIQEDSPNKKIYHLTDKGKEELREWLLTPQDLPLVRHKTLVQIAFAYLLEDEDINALLDDYGEKVRKKLEHYRGRNQKSMLDKARSKKERYLWQQTLSHGIKTCVSEMEWIQSTKKGLKALNKE